MATAFLVGRIIFGLYWLMSAWGHLAHPSHSVGYAQSKGVPSPRAAIIVSGLLLLVGALSILLGVYPMVGIIALVVFLLAVSFKMHPYWTVQDPMARMGERINFMKNMALIGALLMLFAIPTPWAYALW